VGVAPPPVPRRDQTIAGEVVPFLFPSERRDDLFSGLGARLSLFLFLLKRLAFAAWRREEGRPVSLIECSLSSTSRSLQAVYHFPRCHEDSFLSPYSLRGRFPIWCNSPSPHSFLQPGPLPGLSPEHFDPRQSGRAFSFPPPVRDSAGKRNLSASEVRPVALCVGECRAARSLMR